MKHFFRCVLVLAFIFSLAGCAKDGDIRMVNGEYRKVFRDKDGQEYYVKDGRKFLVDE